MRISSISVESNSDPGLCAASVGWSSRMIGDDQEHVVLPRRAGEHGPAPLLPAAGRRRPARPAGRSSTRSPRRCSRAAGARRGTTAGSPSALSPGSAGRAGVLDPDPQPRTPRRPPGTGADATAPRRPGASVAGPADRRRAVRPTQLGDVLTPVRPRPRTPGRRPSAVSVVVATRTSCSTASSQRASAARRRTGPAPATNSPVASTRWTTRACSCRKRSCTVSRRPPVRPHQAARTPAGLLPDAGRGGAGRPEHAELPPRPGSCRRSPGRGRAGSPRRARRRRPRAPRSGRSGGHPASPCAAASRSPTVVVAGVPARGLVRRERRQGLVVQPQPPVPGKCWRHQLAARRGPAARSGPRGPRASARRRSRRPTGEDRAAEQQQHRHARRRAGRAGTGTPATSKS